MTMTFDIPEDVQASVSGIPGLNERVTSFLRHEAQLEALRQQRHSPEARSLAEGAMKQALQDQAQGFDWDSSFAKLREQYEAITAKL